MDRPTVDLPQPLTPITRITVNMFGRDLTSLKFGGFDGDRFVVGRRKKKRKSEEK